MYKINKVFYLMTFAKHIKTQDGKNLFTAAKQKLSILGHKVTKVIVTPHPDHTTKFS